MPLVVEAPSHPLNPESFCSRESLEELVAFVDQNRKAMSFYFDSAGEENCSHEEESLRLHSLVTHAYSTFSKKPQLDDIRDGLELIQAIEPDIHLHSRMFRALFTSRTENFRKYIVLPFASKIEVLRFGRHFSIVPLMRALEGCSTCVTVLVENGKARLLQLRGHEIKETTQLFLSADVRIHPENEREGWPHRVEANADERSHPFFRELAEGIQECLKETGARHLVIGCRDVVWGKLEPELSRINVNHIGRFHLPRFDMIAAEVARAAGAILDQLKEQDYVEFWQTLAKDSGRTAIGTASVLNALQEGRVRKLFLGLVPETETLICAQCGRWQEPGPSVCEVCQGTAPSAHGHR